MKDNQRQVGTQVSEQVAEAVLKRGTYIGRANVVGTWNETAYEPINSAGQTIGIWYVGCRPLPMMMKR